MKTIHVVAAVITKDNKIFCCQRADQGPLAKKWEFPGGKIETGESQEAALIREIKEELNTEIKVNDFIIQVDHHYPTFRIIMDTYHCEVIQGDLTLNEHLDSKWLRKEDLINLDWAESDIPIVDKIVKGNLI
jgi:8-oxo-dGTP diphosphatase